METLGSIWEHGPMDLWDLDEGRNMLPPVWESQGVFTPPAGLMWTQQLSPHLQRNKQLQDTLLQREEELARLQEENNKLRRFLNSSFVRNLQEKAKKLTADTRKTLKRNLVTFDREPPKTRSHPFSKQISKRVCRNLTAEFCSGSFEGSACSEPNLDLWVLRTLGLKDRNTIDTSKESSSEYSFRDLLYEDALPPSLAAERSRSSSSSAATTSTPSSAHSYCRTATGETAYRSSECGFPATSTHVCPGCPGDVTATALTEHHESSGAQAAPGGQPLEASSKRLSSSWFPHPDCWTPAKPELPSSSSVLDGPQTPSSGRSPPGQPDASPPARPPDLAFSMSLSPSSSVKTHSFPQGQAFIRKDSGGRWNFTWVPRQQP
ncbi:geminin coiled-coil domain-containing protein 1 [Fundulus diaphanus]